MQELFSLNDKQKKILLFYRNFTAFPSSDKIAKWIISKFGGKLSPNTVAKYRTDIEKQLFDGLTFKLKPSVRTQLKIHFIKVHLHKRDGEIIHNFQDFVRTIPYICGIYQTKGNEGDYHLKMTAQDSHEIHDFVRFMQKHKDVRDVTIITEVFGVIPTQHHEIDGFFETKSMNDWLQNCPKDFSK